jgi:hypothetical protein
VRRKGRAAPSDPAFAHAADAVLATAETAHGTLRSLGRTVAAVEEVAERARHAPARMLADVRLAVAAGFRGARRAAVAYAIAGGLAFLALAALTVAVAVVLDALLGGAPRGAFVVAGLYAVGATVAAVQGRKAMADGRREAGERIADVKAAALEVARPVRRELARHQRPSPSSSRSKKVTA